MDPIMIAGIIRNMDQYEPAAKYDLAVDFAMLFERHLLDFSVTEFLKDAGVSNELDKAQNQDKNQNQV
jgi:hypothetical protein